MQGQADKRLQKCPGKITRIAGNAVFVRGHVFYRRRRRFRHTPHQQTENHPARARRDGRCTDGQRPKPVFQPASPCSLRRIASVIPGYPAAPSRSAIPVSQKKEYSEQRPDKAYRLHENEHAQIKHQPSVIETVLFSVPVDYRKQKTTVDTGQRQIRAKAVVPIHFRNAGQKP